MEDTHNLAPNPEDRDALMRLTLNANPSPVTSISVLSVSDISGLPRLATQQLRAEAGPCCCSTAAWAAEGVPAHARAALARPFSVAAEGDVDTEVVVVAAAPVGAGPGAGSAASERTGGGGLAAAAAAAQGAGVVRWVRIR